MSKRTQQFGNGSYNELPMEKGLPIPPRAVSSGVSMTNTETGAVITAEPIIIPGSNPVQERNVDITAYNTELAKCEALATTFPNTRIVNNREYSTVQAALDSILDASATKCYSVFAPDDKYSGTWTPKSYVEVYNLHDLAQMSNVTLEMARNNGSVMSGDFSVEVLDDNATITIQSATETAGETGELQFKRSRGTLLLPTYAKTDDVLGRIGFRGYGATGYSTTSRARILSKATQDWTDSNNGCSLIFQTTPDNSSTPANNLTILQDGTILTLGAVGIGTSAPSMKVEINSVDGNNLRLTYNDSNGSPSTYADLKTNFAGDLIISCTSGDITISEADINQTKATSISNVFTITGGSNVRTETISDGVYTLSAIAQGGSYDAYTKVLLHFDGADASTTFTDECGNVFTGTNQAQLDTSAYKFGTASLLLDGTSDYIQAPTSADFDFGSGDFTIDCWCKRAATGYMYLTGVSNSAGNASIPWFIRFDAANKLVGAVSTNGAAFTTITSSSAYTDTTAFHHIAFVRYGNNIYLYHDGVPVNTEVAYSGTMFDSDKKLGIGTLGEYVSSVWFNGRIDEFRISKGIARWTANFSASLPSSAYGVVDATRDMIKMIDGAANGESAILKLGDSTNNDNTISMFGTRLGFYGGTPVTLGAALTTQLTTITHTAPGTPDYAIQDLVQNTGFGFVTADEGNSVLKVIANLQTRCAELEARLGSATGVKLFT